MRGCMSTLSDIKVEIMVTTHQKNHVRLFIVFQRSTNIKGRFLINPIDIHIEMSMGRVMKSPIHLLEVSDGPLA